jgi:hypothetical protein
LIALRDDTHRRIEHFSQGIMLDCEHPGETAAARTQVRIQATPSERDGVRPWSLQHDSIPF